MGPYTEEQINTLVVLNILASTFSFLGATFIIANFFIFDDFRTNFAFKLILFVAIGDVLNSLGNFMGSPTEGSGLCFLQAFLTQFGDIVSFAWVTAISWVIYHVFSRDEPPTRETAEKWYRRIHFVIWPISLCLSIVPFFSDSYGQDNGLCWIRSDLDGYGIWNWGEFWRWICFYISLWGSIAFTAVAYGKIWGQLNAKEVERRNSDVGNDKSTEITTTNANAGSSSDVYADGTTKHPSQESGTLDATNYQASTVSVAASEQNEAPKSGGGTLQRIKYYPFVLFGCYFFANIRRFSEWASPDHIAPFGIAAMQVFTSALLGTCNAILYGFTPVVRKKDSEWIRSKCCGGSSDNGASFDKSVSGSKIDLISADEEQQAGDNEIR